MPWVKIEPTIPAFEREKEIHSLDRAANVIGYGNQFPLLNPELNILNYTRSKAHTEGNLAEALDLLGPQYTPI
jgi:hypothetical protein